MSEFTFPAFAAICEGSGMPRAFRQVEVDEPIISAFYQAAGRAPSLSRAEIRIGLPAPQGWCYAALMVPGRGTPRALAVYTSGNPDSIAAARAYLEYVANADGHALV